mmetsp:Transcript_611/g.1336  ORF Transcript_611/g.1336 Transcript_611/m.1336 type:complete len:81 (+) Transcript_611:710-952(+)
MYSPRCYWLTKWTEGLIQSKSMRLPQPTANSADGRLRQNFAWSPGPLPSSAHVVRPVAALPFHAAPFSALIGSVHDDMSF